MALKQYLFQFDRVSGDLEVAEYEDGDPMAMDRLLELEAANRGDDDVEIVLFSAASLDALKVTHPHYFNKERGTDSLTQLEERVREERSAS